MGNKSSAAISKHATSADGEKSNVSFELYAFPFENIVFEGGSNNLLAYVGAVQALEEAEIWSHVSRFAGSGSGALLAALLAVGYNAQQLKNIIDFNLHTLAQDQSCASCCIGCRMKSSYGWHPNNKVMTWLADCIKRKMGTDRATFLQVYNKCQKELCVVVANLSEGCAEYFHHKTSPSMAVVDAVHMTLASPGLCSPVQYRLNDCDQLFADGGIFHNYPVHSFDGWWLSLKYEDSFLVRHNQLHNQARLTEDPTRFVKHNTKTLGFITYNEFTDDTFTRLLEERYSHLKTAVVVPDNRLAKEWDKQKQEAETALENYTSFSVKASRFLTALQDKIGDMTKQLSQSDIGEFLVKSSQMSDADLKTLFGSKHSAQDIWLLVKPVDVEQVRGTDIVKFLDRKSYSLYTRCRQRYTSSNIHQLSDYWLCLSGAVHIANSRRFVQGRDVERTVGINVRYLKRAYNSQLTKQDQQFLVEQGRQTTRAYLEQYVTVSRPPLKDAPDRRSYCRDDLPHFIDDEVSEIIDEHDYMEDACPVKEQR